MCQALCSALLLLARRIITMKPRGRYFMFIFGDEETGSKTCSDLSKVTLFIQVQEANPGLPNTRVQLARNHPTGMLPANQGRPTCSLQGQHTAAILGETLPELFVATLVLSPSFFCGQAEKEVGVGRQLLKWPINASRLLDHLAQWNTYRSQVLPVLEQQLI